MSFLSLSQTHFCIDWKLLYSPPMRFHIPLRRTELKALRSKRRMINFEFSPLAFILYHAGFSLSSARNRHVCAIPNFFTESHSRSFALLLATIITLKASNFYTFFQKSWNFHLNFLFFQGAFKCLHLYSGKFDAKSHHVFENFWKIFFASKIA